MKTITLPDHVALWTADDLAPLVGVSPATVYLRARTLRDRGTLEYRRCTWTPDQARQILAFVIESGYLKGKLQIS